MTASRFASVICVLILLLNDSIRIKAEFQPRYGLRITTERTTTPKSENESESINSHQHDFSNSHSSLIDRSLSKYEPAVRNVDARSHSDVYKLLRDYHLNGLKEGYSKDIDIYQKLDSIGYSSDKSNIENSDAANMDKVHNITKSKNESYLDASVKSDRILQISEPADHYNDNTSSNATPSSVKLENEKQRTKRKQWIPRRKLFKNLKNKDFLRRRKKFLKLKRGLPFRDKKAAGVNKIGLFDVMSERVTFAPPLSHKRLETKEELPARTFSHSLTPSKTLLDELLYRLKYSQDSHETNDFLEKSSSGIVGKEDFNNDNSPFHESSYSPTYVQPPHPNPYALTENLDVALIGYNITKDVDNSFTAESHPTPSYPFSRPLKRDLHVNNNEKRTSTHIASKYPSKRRKRMRYRILKKKYNPLVRKSNHLGNSVIPGDGFEPSDSKFQTLETLTNDYDEEYLNSRGIKIHNNNEDENWTTSDYEELLDFEDFYQPDPNVKEINEEVSNRYKTRNGLKRLGKFLDFATTGTERVSFYYPTFANDSEIDNDYSESFNDKKHSKRNEGFIPVTTSSFSDNVFEERIRKKKKRGQKYKSKAQVKGDVTQQLVGDVAALKKALLRTSGDTEIPDSNLPYPAFSKIPATRFRCDTRLIGYYADPETRCQVFHMCQHGGRKSSFLCPNGTIFNQPLLTCDHWQNVDCSTTEKHYKVNENLYKVKKKKKFRIKKPFQQEQDDLAHNLLNDIPSGPAERIAPKRLQNRKISLVETAENYNYLPQHNHVNFLHLGDSLPSHRADTYSRPVTQILQPHIVDSFKVNPYIPS